MKAIYRSFCKLEEVLSCTMFFSMTALVLCSALARLINHPLPWSIDVAQILLAWTCFIGADVAYRDKKLVGLDLFTRNLPEQVRNLIELLIQVLMLIALIIFIVVGLKLSYDSRMRFFQTLSVSYSLVTLSLPVSSALMSITACIKIAEIIAKMKNPNKNREGVEQ